VSYSISARQTSKSLLAIENPTRNELTDLSRYLSMVINPLIIGIMNDIVASNEHLTKLQRP
jgi:hypothetical protein